MSERKPEDHGAAIITAAFIGICFIIIAMLIYSWVGSP